MLDLKLPIPILAMSRSKGDPDPPGHPVIGAPPLPRPGCLAWAAGGSRLATGFQDHGLGMDSLILLVPLCQFWWGKSETCPTNLHIATSMPFVWVCGACVGSLDAGNRQSFWSLCPIWQDGAVLIWYPSSALPTVVCKGHKNQAADLEGAARYGYDITKCNAMQCNVKPYEMTW